MSIFDIFRRRQKFPASPVSREMTGSHRLLHTGRKLDEPDALAFLHQIESGEVTLTPISDPQYVYAGHVPYLASNGWSISVFNDANAWDYVDLIKTPDGKELEYSEMPPELQSYNPGDDVAWQRYGIPGYCVFRCVACGERLRNDPPFHPPYLCHNCRS